MSKTAFVTGASRGIGRAIALKLASMDYRLFLLARDEDRLQAVVEECRAAKASVQHMAGELRDRHYMDAAIAAALQAFNQIDVLVNNAGTASLQAVQDADLTAWQTVMDVNFNAIVYLSRHILPGMVERKAGTIINISSLSGRNTNAGGAIYSASKHALNGFAGCLYEDVRDYGIKVSTIMPGFVETDLTSGMGMDANHMIRAEDIAESVQYVLSASPQCCPTEIVLRPQKRP